MIEHANVMYKCCIDEPSQNIKIDETRCSPCSNTKAYLTSFRYSLCGDHNARITERQSGGRAICFLYSLTFLMVPRLR